MEPKKSPTGQKKKNIYIESNIDINCNEDSVKSHQAKLDKTDKIGLKELIKDLDKYRLLVKDLEEKNKYILKRKDNLAKENIDLKNELQKYKTEYNKKNNQAIQVSKEINLIIINKNETKKNLYEAIERLNEELKIKDKEIKFIKSIQEEATRQIMLNNINSFLKDGTKESEELLANLKKHNPNLFSDDNDDSNDNSEEDKNSENNEINEIEDIFMNQNFSNNNNNNINNNKQRTVDDYIDSKTNSANNQYNNIEDIKTEDVTEKSNHISLNNQNI